MVKRWRIYALASCLGALLTATTQAALLGPTPYTSAADSPFTGTSFAYFHLENFEDGLLNTPGVAASSGSVLPPGTLTDSVDADDGTIDGSGQGGRSWYSSFATTSFTFTFDQTILGALPTHAGIVWTDVGQALMNGIDDVTLEAFDALGVSLGSIGPVTLGDGQAAGQTAEDRFFGVTNAGGISRIVIRTSSSSDWEVDHLQYGQAQSAPVPEPHTFGLLGVGLVSLLARRWYRRKASAGLPVVC